MWKTYYFQRVQDKLELIKVELKTEELQEKKKLEEIVKIFKLGWKFTVQQDNN